jgi:salicylate hydroxylase
VVAIVPGTWNRPGWSAPGDGLELKAIFGASRWPGPARMMLGAVDDWHRWALFTVPESGRWYDGTIGLLGDAVHAMLPFAAQGAGMAIEDAAVLAKVFGDGPAETARREAGPHLSHGGADGAGARSLDPHAGAEARAGAAALDPRLEDLAG